MMFSVPKWWRGRWMLVGHCPIKWALRPLVFSNGDIVMLPMPQGPVP
jgi:hypothetical protein